MSLIQKKMHLSLIYFKSIVIDAAIFYRKWRGFQLGGIDVHVAACEWNEKIHFWWLKM